MAKSQRSSKRSRSIESYNRSSRNIEQQKRIMIMCEGETDEIYFKSLADFYRLQRVVVTGNAQGGSPERTVDEAIEKRNQYKDDEDAAFAQVWCVFDTEHSGNSTVFSRAVEKAKSAKLSLAISNPCIEYWFVLHFEKTTLSLPDCKVVSKWLRDHHLSSYEKIQATLKVLLAREIIPRTNQCCKECKNL